MQKDRIGTLDGFRALAIILVILFHYFSRWTPPLNHENFYPYGGAFANITLFRYGYLGVNFFFIISGFVITLTLHYCKNWLSFFIKRFTRLYPSMILCALITYSLLHFIPVKIFPMATINFLPSILFLDPFLISKLLKINVDSIDGAYWSLYVEVKFYFWVSLYFSMKKINFVLKIVIFFNLVCLTGLIGNHFNPIKTIATAIFIADYLPWFIAGIGFYYIYLDSTDLLAQLVIIESFFIIIVVSLYASQPIAIVFNLFFFGLFYLFIYRPQWLKIFSYRPLTLIGLCSYSLYLLHQNLGVTLIAYISQLIHVQSIFLMLCISLLIMAMMVGLSIIIYKFWEYPIIKAVHKRILL